MCPCVISLNVHVASVAMAGWCWQLKSVYTCSGTGANLLAFQDELSFKACFTVSLPSCPSITCWCHAGIVNTSNACSCPLGTNCALSLPALCMHVLCFSMLPTCTVCIASFVSVQMWFYGVQVSVDIKTCLVFQCGPAAMTQLVTSTLEGMHVSMTHLFQESFTS